MYFVKKLTYLFTFTLYMFCSLSCSFKQSQVLFENKNSGLIVENNATDITTHRIQPQDLIQIRNLQDRSFIVNDPISEEPETVNNKEGQSFLVEADSTVVLPMLGRVKIAGLTRLEAANRLETLYSKELKKPIIDLKIVNLKVTLLGEINKQGIYKLERDYTSLVEIIGAAGGFTEKADSRNIKVIRGDLKAPQVIELDLSDIRTLSDSRIMLQNNDIIYIAQNKKAIRNEKVQSLSVILQPVILLLNTALIIYTLTR